MNDLKNAVDAAPWFPGSVTTVPCVFFGRGYCREGDACPHLHVVGQAIRTTPIVENSNRICRFYAMGNCNRGQDCPFSHDDGVGNMPDPEAAAWTDGGGAAVETKEPCRFFARGHCKSGSMCRYSHDDAAASMLPGKQKAVKDADGELTTGVVGFTGRCRFGAGTYVTIEQLIITLHSYSISLI